MNGLFYSVFLLVALAVHPTLGMAVAVWWIAKREDLL